MRAHVVVIETRPSSVETLGGYRWRCSACAYVGEWKLSARSARTGGQRHVAAMERGHDPYARLEMPGAGGARTVDGNRREHAKNERRAAIARAVMRGVR